MNTFNKVEAGRGWAWYGEGWHIFKANPGMLLLSLILYFILNLVLGFIPVIGSLASMLLSPALVAGLFLVAQRIAHDEEIGFGTFLEPLTGEADTRNRLLMLGVFSLGFTIVIAIVFAIFFGAALSSSMDLTPGAEPDPQHLMAALMSAGGLSMMLVLLVLAALYMMAMIYATPRVLFDGVAPWEAIKESFAACWGNIGALLIFGLAYIVLAIIAMIPLGLGLLILVPVMFAAAYSSYVDIFGEPGEALPEQPNPPSVVM
ncbi:MAG: BPSS1780 family membrane protein [Halothiobacillaceae bacterium]|nr:BPSS1780 family membrane protein [Halothiobacillaceae bacterium]